jgi:predicted RNase H-like HicB family nuclease
MARRLAKPKPIYPAGSWEQALISDILEAMLDETARQGSPLVIELIADPQEGGFTARLPDIPAYGEGETEEDAIADLREALKGYIETYGTDNAIK